MNRSATTRHVQRRSVHRAWFAVPPLVVAAACAGFGWAQLEGSEWLRVEDVRVRGHQRLSAEEIVAYAGLTGHESLARLSPAKLEARLAVHPWIKSVAVRRTWPPSVVIEVEERRPVAWVLDDRPWVIDADAHPFKAWDVADRLDLPVITGIDSGTGLPGDAEWTRHSLEAAVAMLDELGHFEPPPELDELHLGPAGRWSILTVTGREVVLGERAGAAAAWQRYRRLAPGIEGEAGLNVLRVDVSEPRDAYVLVSMGAPGAPGTTISRPAGAGPSQPRGRATPAGWRQTPPSDRTERGLRPASYGLTGEADVGEPAQRAVRAAAPTGRVRL